MNAKATSNINTSLDLRVLASALWGALEVPRRALMLFLGLSLATTALAPVKAQADPEGLSLVSRWARSVCQSIELRDSLLIYSNGSTLFVADVSNPDEHHELGHIVLPAPITDVAATSEMIYAVVYKRGIIVVDYSNPESMQIVDSTEAFWGYLANADSGYLAVTSFEVRVNGQDSPYGFRLFDISDPDQIEEAGSINFGEGSSFLMIKDVLIKETQCFVTDWAYGVRIFDISDPTDLNEVANIEMLFGGNVSQSYSIAKRDSLMFLSSFGDLYIFNISDLDDIQEISYTPSIGSYFILYGSILYSTRNSVTGLLFYDISDPTQPRSVYDGGFNNEGGFGGLEFRTDGTTLYSAAGYSGYDAINVTAPENPRRRYRQQDGGGIYDFLIKDNRVICYGTRRLFDLFYDGNEEVKRGNINFEFEVERNYEWNPNALAEKDNYNYLFGTNDFKVIDATNQDSVFEVSTIDVDYGTIIDAVIENDRMYVTGQQDLGILDVSNPGEPVELGHYPYAHVLISSSTIHDGRAYLLSGANIYVVSVNNPSNCREIGQFQINGYILDAVVENDVFYTANGATNQGEFQGALIITDISDLNDARELSIYYVMDAFFWDIAKVGNTIFLAGNPGGVFALDVSDVSDPQEVGFYDIPAEKIIAEDSLLYVMGPWGYFNGITVLKYDYVNGIFEEDKNHLAGSDFELNAYPNPANAATTVAYSLQESSRIRLTIYDLTGCEVARLFDGEQAAGLHRAIWDGLGIASGIYICRMEAGGKAVSAKLTLVR